MKVIFLPGLDGYTMSQRKGYTRCSGQEVTVVNKLKNGLIQVKTKDGEILTVPRKHLKENLNESI